LRITDYRVVTGLYILLCLFTGLQSFLLPEKFFELTGYTFPDYNNYLIFRQSFFHLIRHQDLYLAYPAEHFDHFKYTPTFALLFGAIAWMPDVTGLPVWHALNAFVFLLAIYRLPAFSLTQKGWIALLCAIEVLTSIQNDQSNALLAGLMILAFASAENKRYFLSIFLLALATFIKPFALLGFSLLLFYPHKIRHAIYAVGCSALLFLAPLLLISWQELISHYDCWRQLLAWDHGLKFGFSVHGWLYSWFGIHTPKNIITLIGLIILVLPLIRFSAWANQRFRYLMLSSILIWVVIFNHMAESPTFIIAMAGAAIWYYSAKRKWYDTALLLLVFAFVSLTSADLISSGFRREVIEPYALKAVPCIMLWFRIIAEMLTINPAENTISSQPKRF
jgi:hypothetical protein